MGTSAGTDFEIIENRDHPHACGDKVGEIVVRAERGGSSPRVWGQDKDAFSSCSYDRIIPTRVGTSSDYSREIVPY